MKKTGNVRMIGNFVNGEWVTPSVGAALDVENPSTATSSARRFSPMFGPV